MTGLNRGAMAYPTLNKLPASICHVATASASQETEPYACFSLKVRRSTSRRMDQSWPKTCVNQVYLGILDGVRKVAVKVVNSPTERHQQRFLQEIATLRACYDSNIVSFLGASIPEGMCMSSVLCSLPDMSNIHYSLVEVRTRITQAACRQTSSV